MSFALVVVEISSIVMSLLSEPLRYLYGGLKERWTDYGYSLMAFANCLGRHRPVGPSCYRVAGVCSC